MKKIKLNILFIIIVFIFFGYYKFECILNTPLNIQQEIIFKLSPGKGILVLHKLLIHNKLICNNKWLLWLLIVKSHFIVLKAGTYRLIPGMTINKILKLLTIGKEAQFIIRFIEGSCLSNWIKILQHSKYLKHTILNKNHLEIIFTSSKYKNNNLEGQFYPDTYQYSTEISDIDLLKIAYARMNKILGDIWNKRDINLPYKKPYDLLIMASIIEKETALSSERSKIASVFINRLRIGMRLQSDPTVIYGMGNTYNGYITHQDLVTITSYNTYVITGLPPTPIAMPGMASLKAAANPDKTSYLYFVADGKGGHTFTSNLIHHNKAVHIYRENLKSEK
ncbi:UPF0755 protein YceG [Serratia symbiotica]|nr:UPF0755 protein YceG [Serratia symbiotica]